MNGNGRRPPLWRTGGFTLIEVLVALSILSIIIASFTLLFGAGFSGIFAGGHRSKAQYTAQEGMETVLSGHEYSQEHVDITTEPADFSLVFPGEITNTITVPGTGITVRYDDGERTVSLVTFVSTE
ncbi:MAG: prepilin-type N-terminal cleavage/methylation domain-containing protein [Bacillota bacterium]